MGDFYQSLANVRVFKELSPLVLNFQISKENISDLGRSDAEYRSVSRFSPFLRTDSSIYEKKSIFLREFPFLGRHASCSLGY